MILMGTKSRGSGRAAVARGKVRDLCETKLYENKKTPKIINRSSEHYTDNMRSSHEPVHRTRYIYYIIYFYVAAIVFFFYYYHCSCCVVPPLSNTSAENDDYFILSLYFFFLNVWKTLRYYKIIISSLIAILFCFSERLRDSATLSNTYLSHDSQITTI